MKIHLTQSRTENTDILKQKGEGVLTMHLWLGNEDGMGRKKQT